MKHKLLFALIMTILIGESLFTGLIPHARGYLFDLLTEKAGPVYFALTLYFGNYLMLELMQSLKGYFIIKIALLYRWTRTHFTVSNFKEGALNAPQRVQEDIKHSYDARFIVWAEYFISGTIVIQLLIINLSEPVLVLSALSYALFSVYVAMKFNPKLTRAEKMVQEEEATFRARLVNKISDIGHLCVANEASLKAAGIRLQYLMFTKVQLAFVSVLPYVVLIPALMAGDITLGTLVKHQATFALIVVNASILIHYYTKLVQGRASEERVRDIEEDK